MMMTLEISTVVLLQEFPKHLNWLNWLIWFWLLSFTTPNLQLFKWFLLPLLVVKVCGQVLQMKGLIACVLVVCNSCVGGKTFSARKIWNLRFSRKTVQNCSFHTFFFLQVPLVPPKTSFVNSFCQKVVLVASYVCLASRGRQSGTRGTHRDPMFYYVYWCIHLPILINISPHIPHHQERWKLSIEDATRSEVRFLRKKILRKNQQITKLRFFDKVLLQQERSRRVCVEIWTKSFVNGLRSFFGCFRPNRAGSTRLLHSAASFLNNAKNWVIIKRGLPRIATDCHGLLQIATDSYGLPRIVTDCLRIATDCL